MLGVAVSGEHRGKENRKLKIPEVRRGTKKTVEQGRANSSWHTWNNATAQIVEMRLEE